MSLRLKVYCALATVVLLAAMMGAWLLGDLVAGAPRLVVEDRRTGRVILNQPVVPGARFTLSHRNRFSGGRATGVFEVGADGALIPREPLDGTPRRARPDVPARARSLFTDDPIRRRGLDPPVGDLYLVVHPHTEHRLQVGPRVLDLSGTLPPGTHIRIAIRSP